MQVWKKPIISIPHPMPLCLGLVFVLFLFLSKPSVGVVYKTLPLIFVGEDLEVHPEHDPSWMHSSDNEGLCWETLLKEQSRLHHMDHAHRVKLLL